MIYEIDIIIMMQIYYILVLGMSSISAFHSPNIVAEIVAQRYAQGAYVHAISMWFLYHPANSQHLVTALASKGISAQFVIATPEEHASSGEHVFLVLEEPVISDMDALTHYVSTVSIST